MFKEGNTGKMPMSRASRMAACWCSNSFRPRGNRRHPKGKEPLAAPLIEKIKRWVAEGAAADTPASVKLTAVMKSTADYDLRRSLRRWTIHLMGSAGRGWLHEVLFAQGDGSGLVAALSAPRSALKRWLSHPTENRWLSAAAIRAASAKFRFGTCRNGNSGYRCQ